MTDHRGYPTLSIVTPSLNQVAYLGEALQNVRTQTYPALEHIVLDGGSTDGSSDLLSRIGSSVLGAQLSWRCHPDTGQSEALNEGFAKAKGDIIGWLNADDRYRPECFERVAQTFAQHPEIDILYGDYTFINPAGSHLKVRREIPFSHFILKYHHVLTIPTCAAFFRRRIFDDGHLLRSDLNYVMDLEFFLRLADHSYRFLHLPHILADFRIHPDAKSSRSVHHQLAEHRQVILRFTALHHIPTIPLRTAVLLCLQVPAALLRYSSKFFRGCYGSEPIPSVYPQKRVEGASRP
jgi:glycosyltransferase involved in cell wall biosynthesis